MRIYPDYDTKDLMGLRHQWPPSSSWSAQSERTRAYPSGLPPAGQSACGAKAGGRSGASRLSRRPAAMGLAKSELLSCFHAEAAVWPGLVELPVPCGDDHHGFNQGEEQLAGQALPAELIMEALHVAVLARTARIDVSRVLRLFCCFILVGFGVAKASHSTWTTLC